MAITAGYTVDCANGACTAGVKSITIVNAQDLDTTVGSNGFTAGATGIFTAVTLLGGATGYEFKGTKFTAEFRENGQIGENPCAYSVTQEVEMTFPCNDVELRNALEELKGQNCCGMVIFIEFYSGVPKVIGYIDELTAVMQTSTATSGKALTDSKQTVVTFQCITTEYAKNYTGTLP